MKTYRRAMNRDGRLSDVHVIVELNGKPYEIITQAKHPEKWAEYEKSLVKTGDADKKTKKPKK